MSGQCNPIFMRVLALAACANLAVSCPHDYDSVHELHAATFPADAASAKVEVRVVVPEGDWELRIEGGPELRVLSAEPRGAFEDLSLARRGASFQPFEYGLHCDGGKCPFLFQLSAQGRAAGELRLRAGILFTELAEDGCDRRAPDYVEEEDRERLFEVTFRSYDVVLSARDAGVARDAGPFASPMPSGGLDASTSRDAAIDASRVDGPALDAAGSAAADAEAGLDVDP